MKTKDTVLPEAQARDRLAKIHSDRLTNLAKANVALAAARLARALSRVTRQEDGPTLIEVTGSDRHAQIDRDDTGLVGRHSWCLGKRGYPLTTIRRRTMPMHVVVLGKAPQGMVADHINGDKLDNCRGNLRFVPHAHNAQNRKCNSNNSLGIKGVRFNPRTGKYEAQIGHRGRREYLGAYDTAGSAMLAYDEAMRLFHKTGRSSFQEAIDNLRALADALRINPDDAEVRTKFDRLKALLTTFDAEPKPSRILKPCEPGATRTVLVDFDADA